VTLDVLRAGRPLRFVVVRSLRAELGPVIMKDQPPAGPQMGPAVPAGWPDAP
jgi:hypothetical protein